MKAFVVEAELLQAADLEVLNQHIGTRRKPPHDLPSALGGEIGDDRALATIAGVEIRRRTLASGPDEGRAPATRIIALRAFDLDDVGAEIGQGLTDPGAGQDARELDHPDSGKRAHAFGEPFAGDSVA